MAILDKVHVIILKCWRSRCTDRSRSLFPSLPLCLTQFLSLASIPSPPQIINLVKNWVPLAASFEPHAPHLQHLICALAARSIFNGWEFTALKCQRRSDVNECAWDRSHPPGHHSALQ